MKIIICKNKEEMSQEAADLIASRIQANPSMVLGLATGSTPIECYADLVEKYRRGELDFSRITSFNLDEYEGLAEDDPQSYHYFMRENLFSKVNIPEENIHFPNRNPAGYDEEIAKAGGIDLQLLGLGVNGHIAFIEPNEKLNDFTDLVTLTHQTVRVNSRFFEEESQVPGRAYSMGMGSIMRAKEILLLASGKTKAHAIGEMVNHPQITTQLPVSFVRLHPQATLIMDEEAAAEIENR